jgi:hypothetical protein
VPRQPDKNLSLEAILGSFEKQIERQDDIVYGVALFFECVSLLHNEQESIVETYHKQFRNIIQRGRDMIGRASDLLEDARKDARKVSLVRTFKFKPCAGHPRPAAMIGRAEALVFTYNQLFPNRPRSQEFSPEEIGRLLEEASMSFDGDVV